MNRADDLAAIVPYTVAALRDAGWYHRPDVTSPKRVHVWGQDMMSACGRSVLSDISLWELKDVPPGVRCRARGCRERWPRYEP